jgi:3-phenylpropionate/cinnamic acid dioxygenase small subunit
MTSTDRADVIDTCTRMMWFVDARDWTAFPTVFADSVTLDYTSMWGGDPWVQTPAEIAAMWSALFAGLDATQHLLGNHLVTVDGDTATYTAAFRAMHGKREHGTWTLYGAYRITLIRTGGAWLIDGVYMNWNWEEGDRQIILDAAGAITP